MFGKIDKEKYQAVIYTSQFKINGTVHLLPEERLTDFLGDQENRFVPVTDATVSQLDGQELTSTDFLCLNKDEVTLIIPAN